MGGGEMGDHLARGEELEKKAEKKLSGWTFFSNKHEDAADLFDKAANCYKLAKSCADSFFTFLSSLHILAAFVCHQLSCGYIFSVRTTMTCGWFRLNAALNQGYFMADSGLGISLFNS